MRSDPPVRRDGRCAQCGGPRRKAKPQRGVDPALYASDPFCSGPCCRAWHGVEQVTIPGGDPNERRGRYERRAEVAA